MFQVKKVFLLFVYSYSMTIRTFGFFSIELRKISTESYKIAKPGAFVAKPGLKGSSVKCERLDTLGALC